MNIPKLSVTRPVTVLMIFTAIILLGVIAWNKLPQELFPSISYPQITVVTTYENAAPEEIENLITKSVEEAVGTVNNVKRISSISREGSSLVMVEFNWGTNMDFAALNVREKIDLIKEKLPRDSQEPIVMKYNPFDLPVMNLAVTGPFSSLELRKICRKYIKDSLEKVEGVASASITGGDQREILVEINQPRLRASQISIVSIVEHLKTANLNYPAGTIKENFYEYLIRTMGEFQKVDEIKEIPTAVDLPEDKARTEREKQKEEAEQKGSRRLVYLKDVAKVKDTAREKTSISRYNGRDSVSLVIRKQSGTNTMRVANGIRQELKKLLAEKLPKGIDIQITYDQSGFIKESLTNLRDAALWGGILSLVVLLLFLWEIIPALIIIMAIPVSITATAIAMYFFNINLNMMSLGGLAMGVGMVVDSANVVIENIYRYRAAGKSFRDSIVEGTAEMISPIIGSTLTNIAVFLPFVFVIGIAGQIFKQLSFTISFSLAAAIMVAISLVPVMSLAWKKAGVKTGGAAVAERLTVTCRESFGDWLTGMIEKRYQVVGLITVLFLVSVVILFFHPKEFMPKVDQRQFIIKVDLAPGTRLEITDKVVLKIEKALADIREVKDVTVNIGSTEERESAEKSAVQTLGSHQAQVLVNLQKKHRFFSFSRSTDEVIQQLKTRLENQDLERAQVEYIAQETSLGSAMEQGAPLALEIKGPDLAVLATLTSQIQARLKDIPGVYGIKSSMAAPSPETKLNIRKDKSSLYGLSVREIAITTQVALKGYVATKFKEKKEEEDVDIRVRLRPEDRGDLGNLRRLLVHSPQFNTDIPISELAYLTRGSGPTAISRIDQQRSVMLTANLFKRNANDVYRQASRAIADLRADKAFRDYTITFAGEQQRMQESFASLIFALALAVTLVYMIMAGEFESLWQPLLIMFSVPLSLIGVAAALFVTRTPLSVVAYLGIIMLGGIAVNNGIVLIEFINELRCQGMDTKDAVIEASKTRLRPILMTSLTTILGLLPIAMGFGEGSELQAPLALTVMGGLISSTFLVLVYIPGLYLITVERFEGVLFQAPEVKEPEQPETVAAAPAEPLITPEDLARKQQEADVLALQLQQRQQQYDQTLAELKNSLEEKEARLAGLNTQISAQNAEFESLAKEKDQQLAAMKKLLEEKEAQLKDSRSEDEGRKRQLSEQLQALEQSYAKTLKEKDILKQEAQTRLKKNEESLASLSGQLKQQQVAFSALHAEKEQQLAQLRQKAQEQEAALKRLSEELEREKNKPPVIVEKTVLQAPPPATPNSIPLPAAAPVTAAAPAAPAAADQPLNPRQEQLLEKLKTMQRITRKEYADLFAVSIPTAARDLKELTDKGLLSAHGPLGPGRWYALTAQP